MLSEPLIFVGNVRILTTDVDYMTVELESRKKLLLRSVTRYNISGVSPEILSYYNSRKFITYTK
jgi:hypothetical protein